MSFKRHIFRLAREPPAKKTEPYFAGGMQLCLNYPKTALYEAVFFCAQIGPASLLRMPLKQAIIAEHSAKRSVVWV